MSMPYIRPPTVAVEECRTPWHGLRVCNRQYATAISDGRANIGLYCGVQDMSSVRGSSVTYR